MREIFVVCEGEKAVSQTSLELIGKARTLAARVTALLACPARDAQTCLRAGADEVILLDADDETWRDDAAAAHAVARALGQAQPDAALFCGTVRGRAVAPYTAALLQTGLTADCTALAVNGEGLLLQTRPAFGGSLTADILCRAARPQMASVRPKVFPAPVLDPERTGKIRSSAVAPMAARVTRLDFTPDEDAVSLQEARVIVAGGKGVGSRAGFQKLHALAALLGGAVGATRSAVDAGFAPYACQIGQTGVTVRPRLYLAFGIAGLTQHLAGMSGAAFVAAVNTDRRAPIFSHADLAIVSDWETVCDTLIAQLEKEGLS